MTSPGRQRSPLYGEAGYRRRAGSFYPTPGWVTEKLLAHWRPRGGAAWECAGGDGAIRDVLMAAGLHALATDIQPRHATIAEGDFFALGLMGGIEAIVTNPPYDDGLGDAFVERALALTAPVGGQAAMLFFNEWDMAGRRAHLVEHPAAALKVAIRKRPRWIAGTKGGPRKHVAWYVWDWRHTGPRRTVFA